MFPAKCDILLRELGPIGKCWSKAGSLFLHAIAQANRTDSLRPTTFAGGEQISVAFEGDDRLNGHAFLFQRDATAQVWQVDREKREEKVGALFS